LARYPAFLLAGLVTATVALAGCEMRRAPGPESTRQLRVAAVRRIVEEPALSPAAWSPDGTQFAFGEGDGLFVAVPGGPPRRIAPGGLITTVVWSRPLDLLAVIDRGAAWIVRPDGSHRHRLDLPGFASGAAWSPGGDRLGVVLRRGGGEGSVYELWLVSPDGRFRRFVHRAPPETVMRDLQWFPDSLYLLYGLAPAGGEVLTEAWRVRVSYPDRRRLPVPGGAMQVRLAPTGRAIAYVTAPSVADGWGQVVVARPDGTGRVLLTPQSGRYSGLSWSPQGDKLAFARLTDEAHAEIWIADADGSGHLEVLSYALEFSDPSIALSTSWAPDGRRLLFGTNSGTFQGPIWIAILERR